MVQQLGLLSSTWDIWMEFQVPDVDLTQAWPLRAILRSEPIDERPLFWYLSLSL